MRFSIEASTSISGRADRTAYDASVFINCPFTPDYAPLMRAYVYAVMFCGLRARCAREADDGGEVRLEKILRIIRSCRWSVNDLSMTGVDPGSGKARFNMPFELGLFLAAQRFGQPLQREKQCLIMEAVQFDTQKCLSDIAGQDCQSHEMNGERIVSAVRNWLRTAGGAELPSANSAIEKFRLFEEDLPSICLALRLEPDRLVFVDLCQIVRNWLAANA